MEKHSDNQASSYSWWLDNHNRSHQSQWLQSTFAELDGKIKMILEIIEDNGDTFAKRAEMYYQKRPELIKMVEDLHKSYRALAEKYDQLRSESLRSSNIGSLSNSFRQVQHIENYTTERRNNTGKLLMEAAHSGPVIENPDPDQSQSSTCELVESMNSLLMLKLNSNPSNGSCILNYKNGGVDELGVDNGNHTSQVPAAIPPDDSLEMEKRFNEIRLVVSKLMEDNLSQQAELIKRNDEKRETIRELSLRIDRLVEENRVLKCSLGSQKKSRSSKFRFSNFFG